MPPRLAIITGAGSGLGRAFCRELAVRGAWHIVAADVDLPAAEEAIAEAAAIGPVTGQAELLDVTDAAAWTSLRDRLQKTFPRLDLLINNAGVCMAAEVGDGDLDVWRRVWEVNFVGVLNGCHTMAPWLKGSSEQPAADSEDSPTPSRLGRFVSRRSAAAPRVINVASIAAVLAAPAMGAYSASKAAVVALTETMFSELRPYGVHVTVVAPGFFRTKLLASGHFHERRHRLQAEKLTRGSCLSADRVAVQALRASARGRLYLILGPRARWLWRLKRLAPRVLNRIIARRYARLSAADDGVERE